MAPVVKLSDLISVLSTSHRTVAVPVMSPLGKIRQVMRELEFGPDIVVRKFGWSRAANIDQHGSKETVD